MASGSVNSDPVILDVINCSSKRSVSSGSNDTEGQPSCGGDLIPVTLSGDYLLGIDNKIVKKSDDGQTCSNLIQKREMKGTIEIAQDGGAAENVVSICQQLSSSCSVTDTQSDFTLSKSQANTENVRKLCDVSSEIESFIDEETTTPVHLLRKPSYQQAIAKQDLQPKFVPGILLENKYSPIEECEGIAEDASETKLNQSFSSDSPRSTSPLHHDSPDKSLPSLHPQESPTGSNISRSVSFNDRLLNTSRRPPLESFKYSSVESSTSSIDSPSLESATNERLLKSTPGRLQIISKQSSATSYLEGEPSRSSVASMTREKHSIKNFTTSLTRRISFGKSKTKLKQSQEKSFNSTHINGIPSSEQGVVSYEGLLQLFQCPGCHAFMVPPLLQCRKGHLVCDKCKVSFRATCPVCKQRVTDTSNYMMEQVCQLVRFPCNFMKYGCAEYHSPKQRVDHEHFCIFRPVHCHYASYGCEIVLPLKEMNAHISSCTFKYKTNQK